MINADCGKRTSDKLLREQIRDHFIGLIESGQLSIGAFLPPTRELAADLGVSRDTVVKAYNELESLSCIKSDSTRGYFVARNGAERNRESSYEFGGHCQSETKEDRSIINRLSAYGRQVAKHSPEQRESEFPLSSNFADFNYGGPDPALLPTRRWREGLRLYADYVGKLNRHPETLGQIALRSALAGFLFRSKQIQCSQDQVAIFSNTHSAVMLLCRLLLDCADVIAVEDPGFGGIRNIARTLGLEILPIPVDGEGLVVDRLLQTEKRVKLVYVTANNQEPTGATLSCERRQKLVSWAKENDAWIIEDDFDGFFHYGRNSLPALKAKDADSNVIYMATFWRALFPLSTLGYCVLPRQLIKLIEKSKLEIDGVCDSLAQLTLADMIEDGFFEKYVRRLQKSYSGRRSALIKSLQNAFGAGIEIVGPGSGTQLFCRMPGYEDQIVLQAAAETKYPLISASAYFMVKPILPVYLFDFSCLDESEIESRVCSLAREIGARKAAKALFA